MSCSFCRIPLAMALVVVGSLAVTAEERSTPATLARSASGQESKPAASGDWPWWRGPSRNGIAAADEMVPRIWSRDENVVWRAAVPGRGHGSPIIVGDLICLASANDAEETQSAVAFDRRTGELLWEKEINRGGFPKPIHSKNTHASSTAASDGERLFLVFFNHESLQAAALDLKGNELWKKNLGSFTPKRYEFGYAPSPVIYGDLVIFTGEYDGDAFIVALERATGAERWRIKRPENVSYSTPVIALLAGRDQMLISGADKIVSYDPATGKELWSVDGCTTATCGTLVWDGDLVFASGGFPQSETIAVRADGSREVVWSNKVKLYEQSLLAHAGYVYGWADNGVLYCWRASDGKEMWKQRLRGPISASAVFAGGCIYWANELGTMYVFRPNPEEFELVAENQLGDESFASPAVSHGQMFLRVAEKTADGKRQEWLYCLGRPE